jgi:elongator complex protein 3
VEGTKLYELWKKGDYKPYNTEENAELIAEVKKSLPEWVRIQRIQRDIPVKLIVDGVDKSNLRQIVQRKLKEIGEKCRCIRCREVGIRALKGESPDMDSIKLKKIEYAASKGMEHFLSFEDKNGTLIAYARLRNPSGDAHRKEVKEASCMILRELKVAGEMVPIGGYAQEKWQHHGYGQELLEKCEEIGKENGAKRILVMSGVGVRDYYRRLGYERYGPYMMKRI